MVQNGVYPRIAMSTVDLFANLAEAIEDSVPFMLEMQKANLAGKNNAGNQNQPKDPADAIENKNVNPEIKRIQQDASDQVKNSPLKDL